MATAVTAELAPVTVVHRALLALITAFFVLGAVAIGSTGPPPSSVGDAVALAAMPATWRLPLPWLRCSARGLATRACFAAGGLARRLRIYLFSLARLPLLVIPLLFAFSVMGSPSVDISHKSNYRACCDYELPPEVIHAPWCTASTRPDRRRPVPHHRAFLGTNSSLNLSETTLKALLNRRSSGPQSNGRLRLIVDSGCTIHCHPRPNLT